MDFQIIKATKENAVDMGFVHSCSWQKTYRGIIEDSIIADFTPEKRAEVFLQVIPNQPEEYYLFKVDGSAAGIASLSKSHEPNAPTHLGEIYSIYFHPRFWGTPATQAGLQFCIDRLKVLGFTQIAIWVLNDNIRAKKFYEKYGFTFDGNTQEIKIGKSLLEVRYSKEL